MDAFLSSLQNWQMETPTAFSLWHIVSLLCVGAIIAVLIVFFRNANDKVMRRIILIVWLVLVLLEITKQHMYCYNQATKTFSYQWYIFPFQFCDTPLYILPLVAFIKKGIVKEAAISYLCSFSLFGGLCVMSYPNGAYCYYVYSNIHTMIHHGAMVFIGIFLIVWNRKNISFKFFLKGVVLYCILLTIALVANLTIGKVIMDKNPGSSFNLFFISPYGECALLLLSTIQQKAPYIVFLLTYIVGFILGAGLIFGIERLSHYAKQKIISCRRQEA